MVMTATVLRIQVATNSAMIDDGKIAGLGIGAAHAGPSPQNVSGADRDGAISRLSSLEGLTGAPA
jgi:hypothetical protein